MGDRGSVARFLEIVADRNHPLAPAALIALGDLGEPKALAAIREGLDSRSDAIVAASASAAGRLLKQSGDEAADLRDALARLVADPRATAATREAALESLVSLADPRLDAALATAADDAGLEGGELLYRIETLLRQRKVQLAA
jgi:HEAT repeat protein